MAGSQPFGMCGFSLMLLRMCLKINLGVFIYLCIYFSLLLKSTADCPDAVPSSAETGGTNYLAPGGLSGEMLFSYFPGNSKAS